MSAPISQFSPARETAGQQTLGEYLSALGIAPADALACRVALNPRDADADFRATEDLLRHKCLLTYARMQDGRRLGIDSAVLLFAAEKGGIARLHGHFRFRARRKGIAPGDIVYDYDAAHLLHSFIARARHPTFYDAFEIAGLEADFGRLTVAWPAPMMRAIRRADDSAIRIVP